MRVVNNKVRKSQSVLRQAVEALEARQLLSHTKPLITYPFQPINFAGYTPAQIRAAYGFNSVADNGTGQTIAVIESTDYPSITSDLHAFDQKYGLSDPTVTQYDEFGGNPANDNIMDDPDDDTEECLDVEWAHAIAPGANIDIVQAFQEDGQGDETDLCTAAATAASLPNVSVVSMSFGFTEDPLQADLDPDFVTTQGVTFVASSGDSGIADVDYPASSPNVLSVGGTSLTLNNGAYGSETTWVGSTGGESIIEPTPSYQSSVMNVAHRTTPDVSYDADPNTGFSIYCSADGGFEDIGGTSAGAPQWAAMLAIVNQERVANGLTTLNGASQTLPALYSFYGARPRTAAYYEYHGLFNDITTGQNYSMWQLEGGNNLGFGNGSSLISGQTLYDGGFTGISAGPGYDQVTGLGTPQAGTLVDALASYDPTVTFASHHRHTTATAAPMSRAERRRLQAALTSKVKLDFVRMGDQENSTQTQTPSAHPAIAHAQATAAATPTAALPDSVAMNHSASDSTASVLNGVLSSDISSGRASQLTLASSTLASSPNSYGGVGISQLALQSPDSMSLAALPGVTTTALENFLEASAATTYSTSLQLVRMDAVTALADTVSLFVQQATASVLPGLGELTSPGSKPMAVVLGVLAVDAVLLGRSLRRRRWSLDRGWAQTSFALTPVPADD